MIDPQKLSAVTDIVTHEACPDGVATMILLLDVLPNARVHFLQYNTNEYRNFAPGPNQLWCDFSPLPERNQEFVDAGAIVLDHHKTARAVVEAYGDNGVFGDEVRDPGVCGAVLAFREVWRTLRPVHSTYSYEALAAERFSRLAGVRDTWQEQDPDWDEACIQAEVLRFMPLDHWKIARPFDESNQSWWASRMQIGEVLVEKHKKRVSRTLEGAYKFTTSRGTRVQFFSGNSPITSDAKKEIGNAADLVVGFNYVGIENEQAKIVFSTRSDNGGFDCGTFCKAMGGGGHTKAAGFAISFAPTSGSQDPYSLFERTLERYEAGGPKAL